MKNPNRKEFLKITGLAAGGFLFKSNKTFAKETPLFKNDFELNKDVIFLNNGTIGPSPKAVSEAVKARMDYVNQTGYYAGLEEELERKVAQFVNVKTTEIAFTHNVTEGINIAANGVHLNAGDEVLMTRHEHVGGALPWLRRQKVDGVIVKTFELGNTQQETMDNLFKAVTPKTKVLAIPHVPCTIGTLLPIKEICIEARKRGIITAIDGAHPLGMMPLDLHDLGCDIYASCFHKWMCGPKGTGFLYVSENMQPKLAPIFVGAYSADWELKGHKMVMLELSETAHKYYYGTQNSADYAGIIAAVDFQEKIGRENVYAHGKALANEFKAFILSNSKWFDLLTPLEEASSCNMISFNAKKGSQLLSNHLRAKNIITRFVAESDLNCVRVSFHLYNDKNQLATLIKEIEAFH